MSPLDGVYAKLERARTHARAMKRILDSVAMEHHPLMKVEHPTGRMFTFQVQSLPEIDPEWSLIVGDFLTNLRASLDHLAWQLVIESGGTPTENSNFPIRLTPYGRDGKERPTSLEGLRDADTLAQLDALQPFHDRSPELTALGLLNSLVNQDKHRLLLVVSTALDLNDTWWTVSSAEAPSPLFSLNLQPLQFGDVVASFDFVDGSPVPGFNPRFGLQLALNDLPKDWPYMRASSMGSWSSCIAQLSQKSTSSRVCWANRFATAEVRSPTNTAGPWR